MIIVKLIGGLGNQMFQYAAGRRISFINDIPLKLDLGWFKNNSMDTQRKYELHVFNIIEDVASPMEVDKLREVKDNDGAPLRYRIRKKFLPQKKSHMRERHFHFDPDILKLGDNIYLDGYWQSSKYFIDIEKIIRNEFTVKTDPDSQNKIRAEAIQSSQAVSIHVRRGDYISNRVTNQYHGICSVEYYSSAMDIITRKIKEPHFFIFSDEPDWVRKNFKSNQKITHIDQNGYEKAYEDLRLMSLCKHHIIANSSFSWWGAWLSRNPHKIVIAPTKWFNNDSISTRDLIPAEWIRI